MSPIAVEFFGGPADGEHRSIPLPALRQYHFTRPHHAQSATAFHEAEAHVAQGPPERRAVYDWSPGTFRRRGYHYAGDVVVLPGE